MKRERNWGFWRVNLDSLREPSVVADLTTRELLTAHDASTSMAADDVTRILDAEMGRRWP